MEDRTVRKGIVLAGGTGSRLYPVTRSISKQLLPVYDKPMVYYPLSTLMLAGIRQILLISTPQDIGLFERLLGDGRQLGIEISYAIQPQPEGLPQALVIGRKFIGDDNVALILGDNIFFGHGFQAMLVKAAQRPQGATIFSYVVKDPGRFGVVELDPAGQPVTLEEKPSAPRSNLAVTGLYFFDSRAVEIAASLTPSKRGETEILDVIRAYQSLGELSVQQLGRGFAWLDTGTLESLMLAGSFIQTIEQRQGLKIACIEEVAYQKGFITRDQLMTLSAPLNNEYGDYLRASASDGLSMRALSDKPRE
ncbi:MAG: glucose-1-phosphate thymidylyltransferase RfbA [Planctomycetota bacterium]|nr:glucose-1-phosphate thymidylyltransferase RfbA [Planctomycetota bacterium]